MELIDNKLVTREVASAGACDMRFEILGGVAAANSPAASLHCPQQLFVKFREFCVGLHQMDGPVGTELGEITQAYCNWVMFAGYGLKQLFRFFNGFSLEP